MSLYSDPKAEILSQVNLLNKIQLSADDYVFGVPSPLSDETGQYNTQITVTAKNENSPYAGAVTLKYQRRDLARLATLVDLKVGMYLPRTTLQVAQAVNARFGTNLTLDDIVQSTALNLTDDEGVVTLTAKENSLGWTGTVAVTVVKGNYPLSAFLTNTKLAAMNYPTPVASKPFAELYSYSRDFTAFATNLKAVGVGSNQLPVVLDALKAVTGDPWVLSGQSRYSLDGATVSFVGQTHGDDRFRQRYSQVILVTLSDQCLGLAGQLYLHFDGDV